jgi:2-polyprenyl-3-methyl-5-hydroxy-6-metoxy-1,4-benzoquinol methylase
MPWRDCLRSLLKSYRACRDIGTKSENGGLRKRVEALEMVNTYLINEVTRLSALLRYVSAPIIHGLPYAQQTRESFDFQWEKLPKGRWNLENAKFREEAPGYVCRFTGLPAHWFKDKKVIDVGCGGGRYSWALCRMGAEVLSIDQSEYGLDRTRKACESFPNHRIMRVNLLEKVDIPETFDLVWCFGVLHHTGDTYGTFKKIVPLVKPGGYLFLMLYGEPRRGITDDYMAVNEYDHWRRKTRNMTFDERLQAVRRGMRKKEFLAWGDEYIEGYFDAISPTINDLYSWEEVEGWLLLQNFEEIKRTAENRNHHVIARKRNQS